MAANDTPTPSTRLLRRPRQQLHDALRYAQAGAEKLAPCEQALAEVRRTARVSKERYETRVAELQARIDHLEGRHDA
jgi:exonuclease VII small subunit